MAHDVGSLRDCPTSAEAAGDTPPSPVLEVILEQMDVSSGPDLSTVYSAAGSPETFEQAKYEGSDIDISSVEQLTYHSTPAPSPSNEMELRSVAQEEGWDEIHVVSGSTLNTGSCVVNCVVNEGGAGASTSNATSEEGEKKVRGKGKQVEGNKQPKSKMFSLVCEWGNFLESQDMLQQLGQRNIAEEEQEEVEVEVVVVGREEVVEITVEETSVYGLPGEGSNTEAEEEEEGGREELDDRQEERDSEEERKLGHAGGGGEQLELREEEEQRVKGQEEGKSTEEHEEEEEEDEKQMVVVVVVEEEEIVEKEKDGLEEGKEGGETHGTISQEQLLLPSGVLGSTSRNTDNEGEADSLEMFLPSLPNLYQQAGVGSPMDSAPSSDEEGDMEVAKQFLMQEEDLLRSCGWASDHSCSSSRGSRRHQPNTVARDGGEGQCVVGGTSDSLTVRPNASPRHPPHISHHTLPLSSLPPPPAHVLPTASTPPPHHHQHHSPQPPPSHGLLEAAAGEGLGVVASGSGRKEDEDSDSSFLYHLSGQGREGEGRGGKPVTLETSSVSDDEMEQQQQSKESRQKQERAPNNKKSVPAAETEVAVRGECLTQHQVEEEHSLKPVHQATAVLVVEESGRCTSSDEHGILHSSSSHGLTTREGEKESRAAAEVVVVEEESGMEGGAHTTEGGGEAEDMREGGRKRKREIERNTIRKDTSKDTEIKALMTNIYPPGFSNVFSSRPKVSSWNQLQQLLEDLTLPVATESTREHSGASRGHPGASRGHCQSHRKYPRSVTEEEDITTAEDEPRVTEDESMATENEPRATENEPRATENKPRATENEPRATEDEPRTTEDKPRATESETVAAKKASRMAEREPGMAGEEVEETGSPSRTMTAEEQRTVAKTGAVVGSSKHMTGEGKLLY